MFANKTGQHLAQICNQPVKVAPSVMELLLWQLSNGDVGGIWFSNNGVVVGENAALAVE